MGSVAVQNASIARLGLTDVMECVVVDCRNAMKFKGPEAAAYLATHEDSNRRHAEFRQSDFYQKMKTQQETYEANIRAGLFTVQELAPDLFTAEEKDTFKNTINAPKICDLFTAQELEPLKNWTCSDNTNTLDNLLKEGVRRIRQAAGLYTVEELERFSDNPQLEFDKIRKLYEELYEEAGRRKSVWLVDRKAKALQVY